MIKGYGLRHALMVVMGTAGILAGCQPSATDDTGAALAPEVSEQQVSVAQTYQCGDLRIEIRVLDDAIELRLPDRDLRLSSQVSASGALYRDQDANEFRDKGGEAATLYLGGGEPLFCTPTEGRSPWVAARDRGVVYRAVGQEPGWMVEVGAGEMPALDVLLDYGERRLTVRGSEALEDMSGFQGEADGVGVELRIRRETCHDVMSGEAFETRADLEVGGKSYTGCGRFLVP